MKLCVIWGSPSEPPACPPQVPEPLRAPCRSPSGTGAPQPAGGSRNRSGMMSAILRRVALRKGKSACELRTIITSPHLTSSGKTMDIPSLFLTAACRKARQKLCKNTLNTLFSRRTFCWLCTKDIL